MDVKTPEQPTKSVFDHIRDWYRDLSKVDQAPRGFNQYTHALEGVLQDPLCSMHADRINELLWWWLFAWRTLYRSKSSATYFRAYMHTAIRWLLLRAEREESDLLPGLVPYDYRRLDMRSVRYLSQEEQRSFVVNAIGAKRIEEIHDEMRVDPALVAPSPEDVLTLEQAFLVALEDNIVRTLINSEFGRNVLAATYDRAPKGASPIQASNADAAGILSSPSSRFVQSGFEHTIRIRFLGPSVGAARAGRTIWSIGAALESVDGVSVSVSNWGKGSLWVDIKVWIKNIWKRDAVQEILEKGRRAAESHYLDTPIEQAGRLASERHKLDEETLALERERIGGPDIDQKRRLVELEIRNRELDVRAKEIAVGLSTLEAIRKASELVRDGIIVADRVEIRIDDWSKFLFDGNKVKTSEIVLRAPDDLQSQAES